MRVLEKKESEHRCSTRESRIKDKKGKTRRKKIRVGLPIIQSIIRSPVPSEGDEPG